MEPKTPPTLGIALTLVRSAQGWGQKELAAAYGTSSTVISDYERGHKPLSRKKLDDLLRILGLPSEAGDEALGFVRKLRAMGRRPAI